MQYEDGMHPKEAQDAAEKTALEELQVLYFSVFSSDWLCFLKLNQPNLLFKMQFG